MLADAIIYNLTPDDNNNNSISVEENSTINKNAKTPVNNNLNVLIETNTTQLETLAKYLSVYKLRSNVKIELKPNVYTLLCQNKSDFDSMYMDSLVNIDNKNCVIQTNSQILLRDVPDPRSSTLGLRYILTHENPAYTEIINPILTHAVNPHYEHIRMCNNISEGDEIVNQVPLECNMDMLNGISFTKGCYICQELMARTKYKVFTLRICCFCMY